jgi:hypothetical protein
MIIKVMLTIKVIIVKDNTCLLIDIDKPGDSKVSKQETE